MLHTDVLTANEFSGLDAVRGDVCVSIYLPTTPVTRNTEGDRILFKNLATDALDQLRSSKVNKRKVVPVEARLTELHDDKAYWAYLADGLAVFVTPKELRTFRLPIAPSAEVQVSDRFHVKPLVPLLAFPGTCFVLALSQGATRFVEVSSSLAQVVKVDGLPKNMSDAVKRKLPRDRAPSRRLQGGEGMKVLTGQYCRMIDRALRPILSGLTTPLVLASVKELAAIYEAHNSYPYLMRSVITGSPEKKTERNLAEEARGIAARYGKKVVSERLKIVKEGANKDLTSTDLAQIAHAAARGQVGTLLVDVKASCPGTIDTDSGTIAFAAHSSATTYDVLDELVGLTIRARGEVLPMRSRALANGSPVAAIFRYRG
jgi:hypothetical protein